MSIPATKSDLLQDLIMHMIMETDKIMHWSLEDVLFALRAVMDPVKEEFEKSEDYE